MCVFFLASPANARQALQGQGMAPRLPLLVQDARLLLLRLAHQENLSVDCGGGAARSNIQLIPYLLQVGASFLPPPPYCFLVSWA